MRDISRRVKHVEKRLNLHEKPITVTIVQFNGQLPPDKIDGHISYHFVRYDEKRNDEKSVQPN